MFASVREVVTLFVQQFACSLVVCMASVLLIGDPKLRQVSTTVSDVHDPTFTSERVELERVLDEFRKKHGFGRYKQHEISFFLKQTTGRFLLLKLVLTSDS